MKPVQLSWKMLAAAAILVCGQLAISAQAEAGCSPLRYSGYGNAITKPAALTKAIVNWSQKVANYYGDLFSDWSYAQNKVILYNGVPGAWQATVRGRGCDTR